MILTEKIKIKITPQVLNHFISIGLRVKTNDEIEITPDQLKKYSSALIRVKCDSCDNEKEIKYSFYNQNKDRNNGLYYCEQCRTNRTIQTNLKKYGVENVSQAKSIKEKKIETNIKNWGFENVFQSEEIKDFSKKTKKEKYNDEHYTNREKSKKTCLSNNGVEWPTQSESILQKRNSNNKEKYGVEHYTQTEEYAERSTKTCLDKYGKEYFLSTDECQIKSRITCNEKYGVDFPSQNIEIHKKQFPKMKIHNNGVKYQGSYEKDFLELCQKLNLNVTRGKTIKFQYENKEKIYFSDYYLPDFNLIVEVKSWYTYELHKELNLIKQKSVLEQGYNFIFIVDKIYEDFLSLVYV